MHRHLHDDGQTDSLEAGLQNLRVVLGKALDGSKGLYFLLPFESRKKVGLKQEVQVQLR